MKQILKNSAILLLFFLVFLFKDSIYGLFIKTLELDNIKTEVETIKNEYYYNEYLKLLAEMNIEIDDTYNYIYSKTLYRNIYEYYNELTILKGTKDNIKVGDAVINATGLIGTIKKANKNSSVVSLITNKDSKISVKVKNAYGILQYENNRLMLKSINNYENINIGDVIYTSGIGNLPGNIKVGEILSVQEDNLGIEPKIYIEPYVDIDNINYIGIIIGGKQ